MDALLQRLPGCVSRDLIDQLTVRISYCVLYLFLDCIVIFVVIIYYYCLFVELLDKILGDSDSPVPAFSSVAKC